MKRFNLLLVGILLLISSSILKAQMGGVVYDPTQAANMGRQIANSSQQVAQLSKTVEYMEKAQEKINQVNGYVRNMSELKNIIELQKQSLISATKVKDKVARIKNPKIRSLMLNDTTQALNGINESIAFVSKILSNGFFSMSDAERMQWIKAQRDKVFSNYQKIKRNAL